MTGTAQQNRKLLYSILLDLHLINIYILKHNRQIKSLWIHKTQKTQDTPLKLLLTSDKKLLFSQVSYLFQDY